MFQVSVQGEFRAVHSVRYANGQWEPSHEHDWKVEVHYRRRDLDAHDWVVDFVQVQRDLSDILVGLAGTDLNRHPDPRLANPTAERVAEWIFKTLHTPSGPHAYLSAVSVEEAPGCRAMYMRE